MKKIISDSLMGLTIKSMPNKKHTSTVGYAIQMINAERSDFVSPYMWFLLVNALNYLKSRDFGIVLTDEFYTELADTFDKLEYLLNGQN